MDDEPDAYLDDDASFPVAGRIVLPGEVEPPTVAGRIVLPDQLAREEAAARQAWFQARLPLFGGAILMALLGYILLRRVLRD